MKVRKLLCKIGAHKWVTLPVQMPGSWFVMGWRCGRCGRTKINLNLDENLQYDLIIRDSTVNDHLIINQNIYKAAINIKREIEKPEPGCTETTGNCPAEVSDIWRKIVHNRITILENRIKALEDEKTNAGAGCPRCGGLWTAGESCEGGFMRVCSKCGYK